MRKKTHDILEKLDAIRGIDGRIKRNRQIVRKPCGVKAEMPADFATGKQRVFFSPKLPAVMDEIWNAVFVAFI